MNPLQEVLDASRELRALDELPAATAASLHALRHDRRLEALSVAKTREVSSRLFHTPDIRTLVCESRAYESEELEQILSEVGEYVHQMLIEVVDHTAIERTQVQSLQQAVRGRGGLMRLNNVPFRMHLYDRRLALVPKDFDDNGVGAIAVREPALLATLTELHARLWRDGARWPGVAPRRSLTTCDLMDVLAELLSGATDEAAAAHLHISLRTYRRKVQEILGLMNVRSRFQAGAVAEERKYLELVRPRASGSSEHQPYEGHTGVSDEEEGRSSMGSAPT